MAISPLPGEGLPQKPELTRTERIAREKAKLRSDMAAGNLTTTRSRVGLILNLYPETRNSDRALIPAYWNTFQRALLGSNGEITEEAMLHLENPLSIGRARQKIQNDYGLYQADEDVQEFRRERRRDFQEAAILDKPGRPITGVSCDESGKNDGYVLVGSVWTLDSKRQADLIVHLVKWKSANALTGEFHFNKLGKKSLQHYKAFFQQALSVADTLSFKAVSVRQHGIKRPISDITMELYYHLVVKGLTHEFETGRLAPPRQLQVWKDIEEGIDALHLERVRQELQSALPRHFNGQAELELMEAVDSKGNFLVQLADLFTGSLNRVLNSPGEAPNYKDEFAEFVLDSLGIAVDQNGTVHSANQDVAVLHVIPS